MEISINNWPHAIPQLLREISEAHFVAIDFEFSGISMKTNSRTSGQYSSIPAKQSLQQRYEEVKNAAIQFQVLQVGVTIAKEDKKQGFYKLDSYNIHVSPVITAQLHIDRTFAFQSCSTRFLMKHGFDMAKVFNDGVPYLSRLEETQARDVQQTISNENAVPHVELTVFDDQEHKLMDQTRSYIQVWMDTKQTSIPIILTTSSFDIGTQINGSFTYRQRRLLQHLVTAEYPKLNSEVYSEQILIMERSLDRSQALAETRSALFETKLQQQTGLRHVFEGLMANCDLSNVDVAAWMPPSAKGYWSSQSKRFIHDFKKVKEKLRKPTILVGHNVFVDLVNFYACFIGPPPADLKDFLREIHKMFPFVIDTKYLASHFGGSETSRSALGELDRDLRYMNVPVIHCTGRNQNQFHEAGYDSLVTARVAIRLSAALEAMGCYIELPDTNHGTSNALPKNETTFKKPALPPKEPASSSDSETITSARKGQKRSPMSSKPLTPSEELREIFETEPVADGTSQKQTGQNGQFMDKDPRINAGIKSLKIRQFMPSFRSDFWRIYANKLTVNGTNEGVCLLEDSTLLAKGLDSFLGAPSDKVRSLS